MGLIEGIKADLIVKAETSKTTSPLTEQTENFVTLLNQKSLEYVETPELQQKEDLKELDYQNLMVLVPQKLIDLNFVQQALDNQSVNVENTTQVVSDLSVKDLPVINNETIDLNVTQDFNVSGNSAKQAAEQIKHTYTEQNTDIKKIDLTQFKEMIVSTEFISGNSKTQKTNINLNENNILPEILNLQNSSLSSSNEINICNVAYSNTAENNMLESDTFKGYALENDITFFEGATDLKNHKANITFEQVINKEAVQLNQQEFSLKSDYFVDKEKVRPQSLEFKNAKLEKLSKLTDNQSVDKEKLNLNATETVNSLMKNDVSDVSKLSELNEVNSIEADKTIVQQVTENLVYSVKEEISEFKMKLKPEGLGELEVKIKINNGKVTIDFNSSLNSTKLELQSQINQLKQTLLQNNINVEQININQKNLDAGMQFNQFSKNQSYYHQYSSGSKKAFDSSKLQAERIYFDSGILNYSI